MKILSLDTTTLQGSVALSEGARVIAQEQQLERRTHSERLMDSVARLLDAAGWECTQIEGVAVAVGPGSFTGVRIGLAAAKGIAFALGVPIAGVSSLASLALNARELGGQVVPLIDARRGELYAAVYRFTEGGVLEELRPACVLPPERLVEELAALEGELVLVGDGAAAYRDLLAEGLGSRAAIPGGSLDLPRAGHLAELAGERLANEGGDDLAALVPNYIRRSDAEIGFQGRASAPKGG